MPRIIIQYRLSAINNRIQGQEEYCCFTGSGQNQIFLNPVAIEHFKRHKTFK